ncbi:MAG TPA: carboxypeptidase regulatory-like domain-containing protein, partial [Terriglobia bacterium]|nr:carboxypeptidase regulatory-like domain-containing protein [Terriglobia bacterium]
MRSKIVSTALLLVFVSINGFSQTSTNAQITGVVTDSSGALIPGVTITATKTDTGVTTTSITNESGVYTFQALQPGTGYTLSASLPGFQTLRYTSLELSAGVVFRQNFQLQVATAATTIDVAVERQAALTQSSSSVGDVLPQERISNLPMVGNNVLDLLNILPGVRFNGTGAWMGDYANTIAGQGLNSLNVTLDGLPTRDERFSAQAGTFQGESVNATGTGADSGAFFSDYTGGNRMLSTTTINPDLVGEIRLVLSPVDAEMGRGNSQIQITTRSGTNRYSGSAVWNVQNTALNPNTWNNNNDVGTPLTGCRIAGQTPPCWNPTEPNWRNTHQYTISYGGPIVKNKTFFYVLWDQQISNTRSLQTNTVLSDSARNGIYKYWEGWVPGNATATTSAVSSTAGNPTTASVDFAGNPLVPARWPSGPAYDGSQAGVPAGRLMCFSVFGDVKADGSPFGQADCPGGTDVNGRAYNGVALLPPSGSLWDTKRPSAAAAQLGYFARILQEMPRANYYGAGD